MYLSDIHTHSIASGHGTDCTISDMAKDSQQKRSETSWNFRSRSRYSSFPVLLLISAVFLFVPERDLA